MSTANGSAPPADVAGAAAAAPPAAAGAARPGTASSCNGSLAGSSALHTLMAGCEEHKREHEALAAAQGGGAESQSEGFQANCKKVLLKLKSVLPKLLRPYYNPKTSSCEDVATMCRLLTMVLSREMCEHADSVFDHGQLALVAPRIFTTLRLLVNPRFLPARQPLLGVAARLLNLVQTSDVAAHERLFADLVQLLEDGLRLLGLLLSPSSPALVPDQLLTPETRLLAFQGTLQRIAGVQPPHEADGAVPVAEAAAAAITIDAEAAAVPLPSTQAVFLLLEGTTRMLRAVLLPSEALAACPTAALGSALSRQLLLTTHPRILALPPFAPPTQGEESGGAAATAWGLPAAMQALRWHTVEALRVLLAASAGGVPEAVRVEMLTAGLRFAQGQLALLGPKEEEEAEEREGEKDARRCDVPLLAALLRCLLGLLNSDGGSSDALLPAAIPGIVAALRLCLHPPDPSTSDDGDDDEDILLARPALELLPDPEVDPRRTPRRRLIRHALFRMLRRALLSSPSAARHLPVLMASEPTDTDRWYLADVLACWTAVLQPGGGPHRQVGQQALAAWVSGTGGFVGDGSGRSGGGVSSAAGSASRKRPRGSSAGRAAAALSSSSGKGKNMKRHRRSVDAGGDGGEYEEEGEEEDAVAEGGPASGDDDNAAAAVDGKGHNGCQAPLAGPALVVWRELWAAWDRVPGALRDLERLRQAQPMAQGMRAWQWGVQRAGMQASVGLQLAVLLLTGEEGEGEALRAHVYTAAARLLSLLPTSGTDIFLRCAAFPHLPLNAALTFAEALPLSGGQPQQQRQVEEEEAALRAAVGRTAMAALDCLGKPSHVAAMLAEPCEAGTNGAWRGPLEEEVDGGLEGALQLEWLDKAVVLACCAGTLVQEAEGQGQPEVDAAVAVCVHEHLDGGAAEATNATLVLNALQRCPALARVLSLLIAEATERRVAVRLLRFLPCLLEAAAYDWRAAADNDGSGCPLGFMAVACLAVGHRLLARWTQPEDRSWTDRADPAVPALGRLLPRLARLLDAAYPPAAGGVGDETTEQQQQAPVRVVRPATLSLSPAPRVRLSPWCTQGRDLLDEDRRAAAPEVEDGAATPTATAAATSIGGGDDEAEDEDLGMQGPCAGAHFPLVVAAALPYARPLLGPLVNPWARAAAAKGLFRLLAMTPAADLHGPALRVPAHGASLALWALLGDGHEAVRAAVAERCVAFIADGGKLAQLLCRGDGTAARATRGGQRPRSRKKGGASPSEGGMPLPEGDPSQVPLELAITDLAERFKEALKQRLAALTLLVEGETMEEEAAAAAGPDPAAPFLLGTLLQACGATAMRLPAARTHEMFYLWVVIRLAEIWAARGVCASFAYEQLVRVARRGRLPLEATLALNAWEVLPRLLRSLVGQGMLEDFVTEVLPEERSPRHFLQLALKYAVAACVQDQASGDLDALAAMWARHVEPCLRTRALDPASAAEMGLTPVARMLLELAAEVVPRVLVDGPERLDFLLGCGSLGKQGFTVGTLVERADQSMFCEVLWEMGEAEDRGDGPRLSKAKAALEMLVALRREHHQVQGSQQQRDGKRGESVEDDDDEGEQLEGKGKRRAVANFVAANFLFAISKSILPVDWETRAARRNAVAMRCLRLMLELMGPAHVPAFLPKILSIMKTMLWEAASGRTCPDGRGGGAEVREMACHVMCRFAHSLPDAELRANLSVLVVTLLPAILPLAQWAGDDALGCQDEEADDGSTGGAALPPDSPGRAILLQMLHWLLVTKRATLEPAFASIPFLPALPKLAEARAVFEQATLPPTAALALHLRRLLPLLAHASPDVRLATLRQLRATLRAHPDQLSLLVLGSDTAEDVVSELLTALLRVAASEEKSEALAQACCACLGELGAIDPARVAAVALFEGGASARRATKVYPPLTAATGGGGGNEAVTSAVVAAAAAAAASMPPPLLAPWRTNDSLLALTLLQHLLVPKLRAAAADKDRFPFAVQELLHHVGRRGAARLWEEEEGPPLPPAAEAAAAEEQQQQQQQHMPEPAPGRRATRRSTRAAAAASAAAGVAQEPLQGQEDGQQLAAAVPGGGGGGGGKPKGPMPSWLEWSLRRCGVLDTVRPFWWTNYMVNRAQGPRGPPFFATGQSFERCLSSLVRYLMEKARGPFADVVYCVRGLVRMHHALPPFLLPYLVAETWCYGAEEDKAMLLREVLFVLERRPRAAAGSSSTTNLASGRAGRDGGSGGGRRDSDDHVATQAVLSLLDTLTEWCSVSSSSSSSSSSKKKKDAAAASAAAAVEGEDEGEQEGVWDIATLPVLREFLAQVPPLLLIRASMRIRAHTRALKYLEALVRERAIRDRERAVVDGSSSGPMTEGHGGTSSPYSSSASHAINGAFGGGAAAAMTALRPAAVTDGANNTLPLLESGEVDLLQRIFARLDEPDAMTGLAAARRKAGRPTTARQRIREYEHAEEWSHALQGYEQALQELEQRHNRDAEGGGIGGGGEMRRTSSGSSGSGSGVPGQGEEECEGTSEGEEAARLSRGLLQSLLEMEQNESAVNQFLGMVARCPSLRPHLLPLGAEACWRLQQWPALQEILRETGSSTSSSSTSSSATTAPTLGGADERFQLALGRVLLGLQARDTRRFASALRAARLEAMATLSAASVESYQRAYPSLVRLHILHELEQGFELLRATGPSAASAMAVVVDDEDATQDEVEAVAGGDRDEAARSGAAQVLLGKWQWDRRLAAMSTSVRACAPVVAARRTLLHMGRLRSLLAENWAATAARAAEAGRFPLAESALRQGACLGLEGERLVLEEAKLLHAQERVHEALLLLEPVEPDLGALRSYLLDLVRNGSFAVAQGQCRRAATRLLLATDWMVEAGVKHGQPVLDRYRFCIDLLPKSEACFFALAKYTDLLLEARRKEIASSASASATAAPADAAAGTGAAVARAAREAALAAAAEDELLHEYIDSALKHYSIGLEHGFDSIFQALPRFLTLFFEVGDMADAAAKQAQAAGTAVGGMYPPQRRQGQQGVGAGAGRVEELLQKCCITTRAAVHNVAACAWYTALPQLLAHVGQPEGRQEVQQLVVEAVVKVLEAHPEQAMWATTGLLFSRDKNRQRVGERILRMACQRLQEGEDGDAEDMAQMLQDSRRLFHELIELARSQEGPGSDRRLRVNIGRRFPLMKFLVPVQAALTVSLRMPGQKGAGGGGGFGAGGSVLSLGGGGGGGFLGGGSMRRAGFGGSQEGGGGGMLGKDAFYDAFPNAQMQIRMFGDSAQVMRSKARPKRIAVHTTCGKTVTFLCKTERSGDLRKDARLMEFNGIVNRLLQRDAEGRRRRLRLRTYAVVCLNEESGLMEWVPNTAPLRNCIQESQRAATDAGAPPSTLPRIGFAELRQHFEHLQVAYRDDLPRMAREYRELVLARQPPTFHHWFLVHFPEPTAWFEARTAFTRSAAVWSAVGHVVGLGDRHGENILLDTARGECVHVDFDCLFDKGLTLQRPEVVPFRLTPNMVDAMGVTGYEGPYRRVVEVCLAVLREHRQTLLSVLDPFLSDPTVGWDHMSRAYQQPQLTIIDERLRGIYNLRVPVHHSSRSRQRRDEAAAAAAAAVAAAAAAKDVALPLSVPGQAQKLIHEATSLENLAQMYIGWMPWC